MTRATVRVACGQVHELAEGPVWDAARGRLLWVDITRGQVHVGRLLDDGSIEPVERVALGDAVGTVGAVAPAPDGSWIVAGRRSLFVREPDGVVREAVELLPPGTRRRLNDGKPDPAGRFLVGTLSLDGPSAQETLVSVDRDGTVHTLDADLTLSNGLGWSTDGTVLYSVDTLAGTVYRRPYDVATGATGERSALVRLDGASPDGLCVDAEDHLWVAVWGHGEVRRYSPDGRLADTIAVPAPHTSSVAFAGANLDVLVITTATQDLDAAQLDRYPDSGRVFTVVPGARGSAPALWAGFSTKDYSTSSDHTSKERRTIP